MSALTITATRSDGVSLAMFAPSLLDLLESRGFTVQLLLIDGTDVLASIEDFAPVEAAPQGTNRPAASPRPAEDPLALDPYGPIEHCTGMGD